MSAAKKILDMIESVDPNDAETLDEIDARVWCYIENVTENNGFKVSVSKSGAVTYRHNSWSEGKTVLRHHFSNPKYTRSRDALKSIRPKGFSVVSDVDQYGAIVFLTYQDKPYWQSEGHVTGRFPTEELAELHAIIQATELDRTSRRDSL